MPNILFLSDNEVFKADILSQINHHLPEFKVSEDEAADVIIIDSDAKQLDLCHKKGLKAPIIFLTTDEVVGETKAHRILVKPLKLSSFLDDIKSSINIFENSAGGVLEFNGYVLYPTRKEILNCRNNDTTKLTEKEVAIIKYLYKNKGKIIAKNDLMQEVWGYAADVATHTVETHIYRLRQKVEHDDQDAQLILTSDGGYQLNV